MFAVELHVDILSFTVIFLTV